jgi:WD40 repeat protein
MCFIEDGNILITSSGKENAFYIWKYEENESEDNEESDWKFVLKNTLKEHNSWVWSLTFGKILNKDYIISGGADKRIIIWKLYKGECGTKNLLSIKEHNDSIIVIKFLIKEDTNLIFTGSFDGVIKVLTLDIINLNENLNDENITFDYRCILTIFNKDSQISDILIFEKNNEENNNKIGMIVNCEAYDGYTINEIEFEKA